MCKRLFLLPILCMVAALGFADVKYDLTGVIPDVSGLVRLYSMENSMCIDSVELGKDGKYKLKGKVAEPCFGILLANNGNFQQPVILDGKAVVFVKDGKTIEKGSDLNKKLVSALNTIMNGRPTPEMLNGILAENADNIIPTLLLNYFFDPLGVENVDAFLKNYTAYDNHPFIVTARQKVEAAKKTASGAPAPDFTMEDLQGQEKSLSSYLGKGYVLLDFWASWCAPCIHEMPTLKEAYEKYKAKGFEIISVSLDNNKANWEGGVSRLELPWPQLSDLKGFQSVAAQLYGVRGIPAIFLISPDGKIVAKNLRGQNLLNKLAEIYD